MNKYKVDVAVIGSGAAGLASAIEVKKAELSVLIIERDRELGGITLQCIHNGFGLKEFEEELTGPELVQNIFRDLLMKSKN
jgi:thioredoxin reductase